MTNTGLIFSEGGFAGTFLIHQQTVKGIYGFSFKMSDSSGILYFNSYSGSRRLDLDVLFL